MRSIVLSGAFAFICASQSVLADVSVSENAFVSNSLKDNILTLDEAISVVVEQDVVLEILASRAKGSLAMAEGESQLPDPVIKFGIKNVPLDSFNLGEEAMTQSTLSIIQYFPPRNTRSLKRSVREHQSKQWDASLEERKLFSVRSVQALWFDTFYWKRAVDSLQQDRILFDQLFRITKSLYSVGRKQQHDLVRAELEISRLLERIINANAEFRQGQTQLSRWIGEAAFQSWPDQLRGLSRDPIVHAQEELRKSIELHPALQKQRYKIDEQQQQVYLAEQAYKPQWGVDVSYSYRDGSNPNGDDRSDFFSAMASVQLPLFGSKKHDQNLKEKRYALEVERYGYQDLVRQQNSTLQTQFIALKELDSRVSLFEKTIIAQSAQLAATTLTAYESDAADFSELMRAYLNDQTIQLSYLRLLVDQQQALVRIYSLLGIAS